MNDVKAKYLTIEDGGRESTQSWREVLLDLKSWGMNTPKLAIGINARGSGRRWMKSASRPVKSAAAFSAM